MKTKYRLSRTDYDKKLDHKVGVLLQNRVKSMFPFQQQNSAVDGF